MRPTKYMDRGYYIVAGGGTVVGGPYETEDEAYDALLTFTDMPTDALELAFEVGMEKNLD